MTTMSVSTAAFRFPELTLSQILDSMRGMDIDMIEAELLEPAEHIDKLRAVFLILLETCAGKTEEDFRPSVSILEQVQTLPYPELHPPNSFDDWRFFLALRDLFKICGYHEFSLRDLVIPTSKRARLQLSALINLAKFREDQLLLLDELCESRRQIVSSLEEVKETHSQLSRQLEEAEVEAENKQKEMELVMRECQELELEIARNNRLQASAREEAAVLKKKVNDLKHEITTAAWNLQEAEAEETRLREQVVTSPDRRLAELDRRKSRLDSEKEQCVELERKTQVCKTRHRHAVQITKDVEIAIGSMKELQDTLQKYDELVQKREDVQETIKTVEKQANSFKMETEETERQLHRAEEKIVQQRKQQQMQLDAIEEALDHAKLQLLSVEKERRDGMARVEAREAEVRALETKINEERAVADAEIGQMQSQYDEVKKAFLQRNENRLRAVGA